MVAELRTNDASRVRLLPLLVLALLLIYVLSVGPVGWLFQHILPADGFLYWGAVALYSPLAWLHENSDVFREFYDWYTGLFW